MGELGVSWMEKESESATECGGEFEALKRNEKGTNDEQKREPVRHWRTQSLSLRKMGRQGKRVWNWDWDWTWKSSID